MDMKKQPAELSSAPSPPPVLHYNPPSNDSHTKRWAWVGRFILSLAALAFVMHCTSSTRLSQLWKSHNSPKEHLVLHTGFPAIGTNMNGQPILPKQGAAIAFSPGASAVSAQKESWWDRLFPWRHVHLKSVQLAVHSSSSSSTTTSDLKARLAVCTSTHDSLWQNIPDASQCVASTSSLSVLDPMDDPGVLEWHPSEEQEDAIVLRKKNVYWLIVQTEQDEFDWVYALPSDDSLGDNRVAYETQNGWKLQQDELVPSVMITVTDH
ncbi:hypothetical protein BDB00DRAFT_797302 [Zychaea mexicana]|uniref:uncharacterized protein n=1 Tax=Zychaea mexicana TaxID=64656 RepID=UPI0022FEC499|nr:uncharacterized protein BDB00DRAFT_797302 [Zychaea mexicana]KAI9498920.1 hypothetical protein BDB00DRAFT_797302 [Zychaea mexicana]